MTSFNYSARHFCFKKTIYLYEIGVIWGNITHIKIHAIALGFWIQLGMNQIFCLCSFRWRGWKYIKVGGQKNMPVQPAPVKSLLNLAKSTIFFLTSNFEILYFLWLLELKDCKVPHLKDMIHICLNSEAQVCGMTFKECKDGSEYPCFISYRGSCQNRCDEHCKYNKIILNYRKKILSLDWFKYNKFLNKIFLLISFQIFICLQETLTIWQKTKKTKIMKNTFRKCI